MTKCSIAALEGRGVVRIAGSDAHRLLQDIVTSNIEIARDGKAVHAALLAPQGKILFEFFLLDRGGELLIEIDRDTIPELIKRLTFYKLRADASFEDVSDRHSVWAAWGGQPSLPDDVIAFDDPRLAEMGLRVIAPDDAAPQADCDSTSEDDYHAHRIALGVPQGGLDYVLGDTFPHEANFDQLCGVDFKKGCYVGQEVVGRIQHRGTARKRIVPVSGDGALSPGSEIVAGESSIGTLGSISGNTGLATVRLDRAEKALTEGHALEAGGATITLLQPEWAKFDVPTAGSQ